MEQTCGRNPGTQLCRGGNTRLRWTRLQGEQQHGGADIAAKGRVYDSCVKITKVDVGLKFEREEIRD